jgi:hypothetical protein
MWCISFNDCIFSLTCMRAAYHFIKKRERERERERERG